MYQKLDEASGGKHSGLWILTAHLSPKSVKCMERALPSTCVETLTPRVTALGVN